MENENKTNNDYFANLPAPEQTNDAATNNTPKDNRYSMDALPLPGEEEYLPDITQEMLIEEMCGTDEDGYTRCTVLLQSSVVPDATPESINQIIVAEQTSDAEELADHDEADEKFNTSLQRCKCDVYTLDGQVVNLVLTFDSALDQDKNSLLDALRDYRTDMQKFEDATEPADYPVIRLYFMPFKYPGQGMATFTQPFAFFETIPQDNDTARSVHMLFNIDNMGIDIFHVKVEEHLTMQSYVMETMEAEAHESLYADDVDIDQ